MSTAVRSGNTNPGNYNKNPYVGTPYEELYDMNPYAHQTATEGLWDKVGNFFGFRTGSDKRQDELDNASREYIANVAKTKFENEYNAPAEQAARMRAAGVNPDITGTDNLPSADVPDLHQDLTPYDDLEQFSGLFSGVLSNAFGIFSTVQSLNRGSVGFDELLSGIASNLSGKGFNSDLLPTVSRGKYSKSLKSWLDLFNNSDFGKSTNVGIRKKGLEDLIGFNRLSSSDFLDAGSDLVKFYQKVSEALDYKEMSNKLSYEMTLDPAKKASAENAQSGYNQEYYENLDGSVAAGAANASAEYNKTYLDTLDPAAKAAAENAEAGYNKAYYDNLDGKSAADAVNAGNESEVGRRSANKEINAAYRELVHDLYKKWQNGSDFAGSVLLSLMSNSDFGSLGSGASAAVAGIGKGIEKLAAKRAAKRAAKGAAKKAAKAVK